MYSLTMSQIASNFTSVRIISKWNHDTRMLPISFSLRLSIKESRFLRVQIIASFFFFAVAVKTLHKSLERKMSLPRIFSSRKYLLWLLSDSSEFSSFFYDYMRVCVCVCVSRALSLSLFLSHCFSFVLNRQATEVQQARVCVLLLSLVFIGASFFLLSLRVSLSASIFWYSVNVIVFSSSWASDNASTFTLVY